MIKIVPTVLANTEAEFGMKLRKLLKVADELQFDIMDGKFVPSMSIPIHQIPEVRRYRKRFEAHLMVQNPGAYIQPMARRGIKRILFHVEPLSDRTIRNLIDLCRKHKMEVVLAINPETPVSKLLPYVKLIDGVLFLGVHPGFNGAPYVAKTPARIKEFVRKNSNPALVVQVDGGMTPKTIAAVVAAGATRINSGSFVSNAPDPAKALRQLYAAVPVAKPAAKPKTRTAASPKRAPAKRIGKIVKTKLSKWTSK
jgi:ribulose-phosphate 3-epimerase